MMIFKKYFLLFFIVLIFFSPYNAHLHLHVEKHHDHHHVNYDVCHDEIDPCVLHADIETDLTIVGRLFLLLPLLVLLVGLSLLNYSRYNKTLFVPFVYYPFPYHFNETNTFLKSLLFHAPPAK